MGQQSITPPPRLPVLLWVILFLLLSVSVAHTQTQATALPLILPSAIAYDAQGNLYIAETGSNTIRKVDTAGLITTIAGTGTQGFSGDNGPATAAQLDSPQGLALDASNHLYIADTHNHRIRKLDLTTGLITTIAGATAGFSGDNGLATAAQLDLPTALAVDANNLYIADTQNYRVRKIAIATGLITTVAGNGIQGFSGDGGLPPPPPSTRPPVLLSMPLGNLYIADTHNHRIRKIAAATGIITTIAGTGAEAFAGDNAAATAAALALPHGLSIDAAGNLYIADTENHRIRRIDAVTGAITTVAGNGTQSFSGDDGAATLAALDSPRATAISPAGLPTLADTANQRVRQLDTQPTPDIHTIAGLSPSSGETLTLVVPPTIVYGTGQLIANLASSTLGHWVPQFHASRHLHRRRHHGRQRSSHRQRRFLRYHRPVCWLLYPHRLLHRRPHASRNPKPADGLPRPSSSAHRHARRRHHPLRPSHPHVDWNPQRPPSAGRRQSHRQVHHANPCIVTSRYLPHLRFHHRNRQQKLHSHHHPCCAYHQARAHRHHTVCTGSFHSSGSPVTFAAHIASTTTGIPFRLDHPHGWGNIHAYVHRSPQR